ncbi:histidine kinase [Streptomyces sp. RFCAC02]|uniref:sensor histidine kinase n=1 Tax=Streptomyces sp. RFCAC02 TaxID=2499143 RepID=UPI00143DD9D8|nr:histidine kinase [Streptomyces sp. RFCAC02]
MNATDDSTGAAANGFSGRRPGLLAEAGLWVLALCGVLSVNAEGIPSANHGLALTGIIVATGAVHRFLPPAALVIAVSSAAWDDRCYAAVALIAFLAGRYPTRRPRTPGWVACAVLPSCAMPLLGDDPVRELALVPLELLILALLPWLVGRYTYQRLALDEAGWRRARRLEHEAALVAEQTRLRERARIAQDMHDSLGHDLGLLAVRAAVLEMTPDLDPRVRAQAAELRAGAGAATERLHEIIGVLRDDPAAPVTPAVETPGQIADRCRASGMTVTLDTTGTAPDDLSPMTAHALHRLVQEALTNAAKHAPGAPVRVTVHHGDGVTTARVTNDPPPAPATAARAPGSGHGLTGLRERVRLLGGTLDTGPTDDGGYRVAADLPHRPTSPADRDPAPSGDHSETLVIGRRTLRRGFAKAVGITVGGVALAGSVYVAVAGVPALDAETYDALEIGDSRTVIDRSLPGGEFAQRPDDEPAPPPGSTCQYYAASERFSPTHVYRLCFRDDHLVSKDRLLLDTPTDDTSD